MLVLITQGDQREHLAKTADMKTYLEGRTQEILLEYLSFHNVTLVYMLHREEVTNLEEFAESVLDTGICRIFDDIGADNLVYFNSGTDYENFLEEIRVENGTLRSEIEQERSVTSSPFDDDRYPTLAVVCKKYINESTASIMKKYKGCRIMQNLSSLSEYIKVGRERFTVTLQEKTELGSFPRGFAFNTLDELKKELSEIGWEFIAAAKRSAWGAVEITPFSQRSIEELNLPFIIQTETLIQITEEEWENAPDHPFPLPTDSDLSD